jgi:hypothetical protein
MHAVVRSYSGQGAKELFDLLAQRKDEVGDLIGGVPGFSSYTIMQTPEGGMTVTVCDDKAGTDESLKRAREWIASNAPIMGLSAPMVSEGDVTLQRT